MLARLNVLKFVWFYLFMPFSSQVEFFAWWKRDFRSPAPHSVKMSILGTAKDVHVWVETGTFMGRTTKILAQNSSRVISIEPSTELAARAAKLFVNSRNIEIVNGLSEVELEPILETLPASSLNIAFWLDGHYSEGITHLGPIETPIIQELKIITSKLQKFHNVTVFIDDFRCFVSQQKDYPATSFLSEWATSNNLKWSVEHDIFIARKSMT
jgi:hypothetical protein